MSAVDQSQRSTERDERRRTAVRATALKAHKLGLCVLPVTKDGKKTPGIDIQKMAWSGYQDELPSDREHQRWFSNQRQDGLGLVTGPVSHHLVGFEFDAAGEIFQLFVDTAESLGEEYAFIAEIRRGYEERSPSGGIHWLISVPGLEEGNTKLACRPKLPHEKQHDRDDTQALIETRGRGGYIIIAPSGGPTHPTGNAYELVSGSLTTIATITIEQYRLLCDLAHSFDQMPNEAAPPVDQPVQSTVIDGLRPGDDFNQRTTWEALLDRYGWQVAARRGDVFYVVRPGKNPRDGHSATVNIYGSDLLKVFTSSTELEPGKTYSKFGFYAFMEHGGDFQAAAKALGAEGYGDPLPRLGTVNVKAKPAGSGQAAAPPQKSTELRLTDYGNAQRLVARTRGTIRYCPALGRWLAYDEGVWSVDDEGFVMRAAKASAIDLYTLAKQVSDDERPKLIRHAIASESDRSLRAAVNLATTEPGIPVKPDDLDRDPMLLNVQNGTIDLRTGQLRAANPADYITKRAPVTFDPAASCPTWEAFLDQIFERDKEMITFAQVASGYSITGDTSERATFFAWGAGRNGKTTFTSVIGTILGDYAQRTPTETLMLKRGESGVPNDVARLKGTRFVTASETEEGRRLNVARIKDLSGNDTISARFMRGEWFDFRPQFKLWLSTNHKPVIPGHDQAIFDRIRLIPFTYRVPDDQIDKHLEHKLLAEASGILNWLIQGCVQWQQHGLPAARKIVEATRTYQAEMDQLGQFLDDRCLIEPGMKSTSKQLYAAYLAWCEENGEKSTITNAWFGRKLAERGFEAKLEGKGRARTWQGIGVLDDNPTIIVGKGKKERHEQQKSGMSGSSGITDNAPPHEGAIPKMPLDADHPQDAAHPGSNGKQDPGTRTDRRPCPHCGQVQTWHIQEICFECKKPLPDSHPPLKLLDRDAALARMLEEWGDD
jgi:putative DNA primase/helicase